MVRLFVTALVALACAAACASPSSQGPRSYVIVHGAFQDCSSWRSVEVLLEARGDQAVCVDLPGRAGDTTPPAELTLQSYRDAVLRAVYAADRPVILVGHSFGGITVSNVAEAAPERIHALVYVAAYLPRSGDSLQSLSAEDHSNRFSQENFLVAPDYSYAEVLQRDRVVIFCADCDPAMQQSVEMGLLREPLRPMGEAVTLTPDRFGAVSKIYVRTENDNAISPTMQALMLSRVPVNETRSISGSHTPQLARPDELAQLLSAIH